jgi:hypothetical protein
MKTMTNAIVTFGVTLVIGAAAASAQAPPAPPPQAAAKPRPPQSFPMYLQGQYDTLKRNMMGSAEKMPIEHFAFKPTPEVMSYGRLFGHTMETQYSYCNAVKGGVNPAAGKDFEKVLDKATVIQMVKDSFAYCDDAHRARQRALRQYGHLHADQRHRPTLLVSTINEEIRGSLLLMET